MASTIPEAGAPRHADARPRARGATRRAPGHAVIEDLAPLIDCGRYRVKRCVGDRLRVGATIFRDGHDSLRALVRYRGPADADWREAPLRTRRRAPRRGPLERRADRGRASALALAGGRLHRPRSRPGARSCERKLAAGQSEVSSELAEGAALLAELRDRAAGARARRCWRRAAELIGDERADPRARTRGGARPGAARGGAAATPTAARRRAARWSSWRSSASGPGSAPGMSCSRARGAASRACAGSCHEFAELGFDVLYLPPIHPIGVTRRKGRDDAPEAGAGRSRQPLGDRLDRGRTLRGAPRARHARGLRPPGR